MNILITGAAQGIGAAIAQQLARAQNHLILVDLQQEKLKELQGKLTDTSTTIIGGNLADESFLRELENYIMRNQVDVLINNAAIVHKLKAFTDLEIAEFDSGFDVNVRAPFRLSGTALRSMNPRGFGQIINIASRANIYGYVNMGVYAATKAALTSFTNTIALENPAIKAITIIPGRTNTPMQASIRGEKVAQNAQSPEYVAKITAQIIESQIQVNSGEVVIIDNGEYKIGSQMAKADFHRNMN